MPQLQGLYQHESTGFPDASICLWCTLVQCMIDLRRVPLIYDKQSSLKAAAARKLSSLHSGLIVTYSLWTGILGDRMLCTATL